MTLYIFGIWALVLFILGLAIYIAIARLPGFTKKRDLGALEDEPNEIRLKLKPDYEFSSELRTGHETHHEPRQHDTHHHDPELNTFAGYEIPWGYGDNKIVLMTKDPHWLFTYWELTDDRKDKFKRDYGEDIFQNSYPVLMVYDKSRGHAEIFSEITINDYARSWYINVLADCSYQVVLGRKTYDGRFLSILESNLVRSPREKMSGVIDENWPPIPGIEKYYSQFSFNEVLSSPDSARKD